MPIVLLLPLLTGCSGAVHPYLQEPYPSKLSSWHIFKSNGFVGRWTRHWDREFEKLYKGRTTYAGLDLDLNDGVVPYGVNAPLFADYAAKMRTISLPPGTVIPYKAEGVLDLPTGTVLSKTFSYSQRLMETRVLVNTPSGWVGLPYVWNEDQSEATLEVAGVTRAVSWNSPDGAHYNIEYRVPNVNQCKECHESYKKMQPLGLRIRQLNGEFPYAERRTNQLEYWHDHGLLSGVPPHEQAPRMASWEDPGDPEARARSYLDSNCAHCHKPGSAGDSAGLYLGLEVTDPLRLGVCKTSVSAGPATGGLLFDVVPGKPDASIMVHRMESAQPKIMMPELGRTLVHAEGVELIRAWIQGMGAAANGSATSSSCE